MFRSGRSRYTARRLRTDYVPRIPPLIVNTLGRSGSTWLMQMLASHPQVVVFRRFPYESTPAKYWLHALRVLYRAGELRGVQHPDTFDDPWWVGNNPYHDDRVYEQDRLSAWFAGAHVESMAASTTEDDRRLVHDARDHPGPVRRLLLRGEASCGRPTFRTSTWELYPRTKEIFLVRDFRDMARSILAFDAKRGFAGFGRPEHSSDEEYMRGELRRMVADLLQKLAGEGRPRPSGALRGPGARTARDPDAMLEYLELDSSPETVGDVLAHGSEEVLSLPGFSYEASEIASHRTVPDPNATIGRWQSEGDESLRALAEEVFGDALREFGYA